MIFEGDGEVTLPPVSQPVGVFGPPIETLSPGGGNLNGVSLVTKRFVILNVTPLDSASFPVMSAGTWLLNLSIQLSVAAAAVDTGKSFRILLNDPNGTSTIIFEMLYVSQTRIALEKVLEMTFSEPGWFFSILMPAGVITDAAMFSCSILHQKIL